MGNCGQVITSLLESDYCFVSQHLPERIYLSVGNSFVTRNYEL